MAGFSGELLYLGFGQPWPDNDRATLVGWLTVGCMAMALRSLGVLIGVHVEVFVGGTGCCCVDRELGLDRINNTQRQSRPQTVDVQRQSQPTQRKAIAIASKRQPAYEGWRGHCPATLSEAEIEQVLPKIQAMTGRSAVDHPPALAFPIRPALYQYQ